MHDFECASGVDGRQVVSNPNSTTISRRIRTMESRNNATIAVNVTNPISIPDVPTKRRDVSEHDEMDNDWTNVNMLNRQHHASTSSTERREPN